MSAHILKTMVLSGGLHRLVKLVYGGQGMILCFHQVYPEGNAANGPSIDTVHMTPDDLDTVLGYFDSRGCAFVSMDDVPDLLTAKRCGKPFVAVTFDDGYVDTMKHAMPVMERYGAPFTVYASTGQRDENLALWLVRLEQMIAVRDEVFLPGLEGGTVVPSRTRTEKITAYLLAMHHALDRPDGQCEAVRAILDGDHRDVGPLVPLLMTAEQLKKFSRNPLVTIGAHTVTHANLAALREDDAYREMVESKHALKELLGHPADHIAYPFGANEYAGQREFDLAREAGFRTGVTYRHAHLFREHAAHLTALPRLVIDNASCRDPRRLRLYECGYMAMKQNRYRRVVTA